MPKIIDFHIHPPGPGGLSTQEQAEMAAYFRGDPPPSTTEEMADYYIERDIFGVLFAIDNETVSGRAAGAERLLRRLRASAGPIRSRPSATSTRGRAKPPYARPSASRTSASRD